MGGVSDKRLWPSHCQVYNIYSIDERIHRFWMVLEYDLRCRIASLDEHMHYAN